MNYYEKMRTNWFRVTNEQKLQELLRRLEGKDLEIRRRYNSVCITCSGQIYFDEIPVGDSDFYRLMQPIIAQDDVMVVQEIESEGTRYFCAYADIITKKEDPFVVEFIVQNHKNP